MESRVILPPIAGKTSINKFNFVGFGGDVVVSRWETVSIGPLHADTPQVVHSRKFQPQFPHAVVPFAHMAHISLEKKVS